MALLTAAAYPAIRASLDTELTAADLPDAIIQMDIYSGAAEADVLTRDPLAAGRVGADGARVLRAAIFFAAAALAPVVALRTTEQLPDYSYQRTVVRWDERARLLRARGTAELDAILAPPGGADDYERPVMMRLARGGRGR